MGIGVRFRDRFVRNAGWIGTAEMMARVSRLLTAVVLARCLEPVEFGVAAIAMTTYELIREFNQNGIGAKIVQVDAASLEATCNTAWRLNWIVAIGLVLVQCLLAFPVAWYYDHASLAWMVMLLAGVYLLIPLSQVQVFLIQRQNRLKPIALLSGAQVTVDNLLTAALAIAGLGAWAVVLPKLLVTPVWVFGIRRFQYWRPQRGAGLGPWREIVRFGKHVLGVEVLKAMRLHLDNLVIGRFLGLEALGIYYFARNAGLGISLSLINSFNTALYPHFCEARGNASQLRDKFHSSLQTIALIVPPLIILQAALAPWYVPLVFGEQWSTAVPVLMLLCLSALPRPFGEGASQMMRALDRPDVDFYWGVLFTGLFVSAVVAGLSGGVTGVALAVLLVHVLALPAYTLWVERRFLPAGAPG
ncbi:MAG: lipopolysaccharide biosynthesis protein [Gammaproteobacteria bacterium]|nr:lipopolysaccharide biosynthesis protein [Gammaproteobacteria bacterium]